MTFRVLVTGSQVWTDPAAVWRALDQLQAEHPDLEVIHGHCKKGVDVLADKWCRHRGLRPKRFPADWRLLGKRAGILRNLAMVRYGADLCLAFIRDNSPGASQCAAAAQEAGIPTITVRED